MKKILFTLCVSYCSVAFSQNINFSDSKFKALILSSNIINGIAKDLNGNPIAIDTNGDGEIQLSEAQQVVILNVKIDKTQYYDPINETVTNYPYYFAHLPENISDALLFTNVEELYISDTKNANISFVNNNKIKKVMCMNRQFYTGSGATDFPVDLTIDNCPSILTMNDISAFYVSPLSLVQTIFRIKNNPLFNGALVMNSKSVSELYFENINLTSINIDNCIELVKLSVPNIATLQTINITTSQMPFQYNQEINLIANNCTALHEININDSYDNYLVYLSAINVNGCSSLKKINGLNTPNIDFSTAGLVNLEELDCTGKKYSDVISLNLTGLPNLKRLLAGHQKMNNINFTACPLLEKISIYNSAFYMTSIDVSNLTYLQTLDIRNDSPPPLFPDSSLLQVNAQNCISLVDLKMSGNHDLKTLNLQNCSSLQTVGLGIDGPPTGTISSFNIYPDLNTLNISGCTQLKSLELKNLTSLPQVDVSSNVALEYLSVKNLPLLSNLNSLPNNVNLKTVSIEQCPLIDQIDLSSSSGLQYFYFNYMSNLASLNIRNGAIESGVSFNGNYNPNLSVCVDDGQLTQLSNYYPNISFTANCNNLITTVWNGTTWSNGIPTASANAIINAPYSTASNTTFTAKNIIVNNEAVLEITAGNTINAADVTIKNGGNLIQRDGSTLNYTGNFTVNKSGLSALNKYAFWASPVASQNLSTIYGTGNTPQFITEYDTTTDYFVNAASTTSAFGKGYSIKTPTVSNVVFMGTPNNGSQTYTLATTGNRFNLVGNPYPSNLNLDTFYTANQGRISNTLYFWDNMSNSVTTQGGATSVNIGYATYNASTSAWVPAPNIVAVPTGNIANIGQGFFVRALPAPSDTFLSFTNDMRVATSGTFFNKNNFSTEGKF